MRAVRQNKCSGICGENPWKNISDDVLLQSSYTLEAGKFTKTKLLHRYFLGILTADSHGNFEAIFRKFSKMGTVFSKNTFFSRIPPVAALVNRQN